ncbi:MAG: hypothetical protein IT340_22420 [Chloroflexi bacterium]|nr:hypothetical protein [Chloroflexota bacterium]
MKGHVGPALAHPQPMATSSAPVENVGRESLRPQIALTQARSVGGTNGEREEVVDGTLDDVHKDAAVVGHPAGAELRSSSRLDAALPFLRLLPIDALHCLVEEASSSLSAFELPSTEVQLLLDDVSLSDFARAAAEVAVDFVPAEGILRRPLDSIVRPLYLLSGRAITADHLPPMLLAVVRQHMAADWDALASIYLGDVLEWPAGSAGLVKELLASAIQRGLVALQSRADVVGEPAPEHSPGGCTPADADIVRAIRTIATWATAVSGNASVADALLLAAQTVAVPSEVAAARELLVTADARCLASSGVTAYDPDAALHRVLQSVRTRELPVLLARPLALLDPPTLNELGDREGITRERIRQLEAKGLQKLRKALGKPQNQAISSVAQQFAARFGAAASVVDLLDSYPDALGNDVSILSQETIRARVLLWVAGPYEVKGEWLVRAPYKELVRQTVAILDQVTAAGPVLREEALSALGRLDVAPPYRERWLDHMPGFRTIDGRFVAWRGTLVDKVETVLRLSGEPLTKEQLAEAIGYSSPRAIGDRVLADARFVRPSLKHIALREWGLEEYSSVEEEMAEEIRRQGGEAEIDHVVNVLTRKFGVSEHSVRMYAGGPNFIQAKRGVIRLRREDDPLPVAPPVDQARRCYRLMEGWATRVTLTADVLRGSGTPVHPGFVGHVGVACLESKTVPSVFGGISIGWSSLQAWVGSLRQPIEGLSAQVGDYLFIEYTPRGDFQYTLVRAGELDSAAPAERLALEVGTRLDRWNGDVLAALAHALGLGIGGDQSPSALRLRLRSRGEEDLVSLLDESADVVHDDQSLLKLMEYVLRGPSSQE